MDRAVLARESYRGVYAVVGGLVSGGESASPEGEVNGGPGTFRLRGSHPLCRTIQDPSTMRPVSHSLPS
jgi:hypothetical protein